MFGVLEPVLAPVLALVLAPALAQQPLQAPLQQVVLERQRLLLLLLPSLLHLGMYHSN